SISRPRPTLSTIRGSPEPVCGAPPAHRRSPHPGPAMNRLPHHHFTVDVEEYFHPSALEPYVPRSAWAELERRSPAVIERLLRLLDDRGVVATFFTLGW